MGYARAPPADPSPPSVERPRSATSGESASVGLSGTASRLWCFQVAAGARTRQEKTLSLEAAAQLWLPFAVGVQRSVIYRCFWALRQLHRGVYGCRQIKDAVVAFLPGSRHADLHGAVAAAASARVHKVRVMKDCTLAPHMLHVFAPKMVWCEVPTGVTLTSCAYPAGSRWCLRHGYDEYRPNSIFVLGNGSLLLEGSHTGRHAVERHCNYAQSSSCWCV